MQINWSRIIAILTFIATIMTVLGTYFGSLLPPDVALLIAGLGTAIVAFTERVQGGASKV